MVQKKIIVILSCIVGILLLVQVSGVRGYLEQMKMIRATENAFYWTASEADMDDPLMLRIEQEAGKRRIPPIEPIIDRVWKLVPGYNGLEIDVKKTYALSRGDKNNKIYYVYREVFPTKQIDHLMPNPIYKGNPKKPMAALMINVAWGDEFIEPMLKTLDDEHVKATFFFDGKWLKSHIETAKEIQKRGHQLENHAYSHKNMSQISNADQHQEILKTKTLLEENLGITNQWFAPPSGDFNMDTVKIAHQLGLKTVLWTLDTVDWRKPSPSSIVQKIGQQAGPGTLILMHPTSSSSQALKGMIRAIKNRGLSLGTINETLSSNRVSVGKVEQR